MKLTVKVLGTGPRLVMIHGFAMHAGVFETVLPYLTPYFSVQLINLPGCGGLSAVEEAWTLEQLTDLLAQEIEEPSYCLGWSLGGLLSYSLAIHYPEKKLGLVQVATSPCFLEHPMWPGIKSETFYRFYQSLAEDYVSTVNQFLALQVYQLENTKAMLRELKACVHQKPSPSEAVLFSGLQILQTTDLRVPVGALSCPILGIYGRLDALVPIAMTAQLTNHRVFVLPHASHVPFFSHPNEFACILKNNL